MKSEIVRTGSVDRRTFLRTVALGASALAIAPGLVACGGSSTPGGGTATGGKAVALPDFVAANAVKPDLPGNAAGLQDAFLRAVTNPVKSVKTIPGSGGNTSVFLASYNPPPPPVSSNAWWQSVNKAVGSDLQIQITPAADYPSKFASVMAGNDIPDLVSIPLSMNLPRLPDLFSNRFADLSDHLSGSKVRDYPNLAGIPTYSWRNARVNGRIYGVPVPRAVFTQPLLMRTDLLKKLGVTAQPTSAAEFLALAKEVTDAKSARWALGSSSTNIYNLDFLAQVFGAPRIWRNNGGKLTKDYETQEYMDAVAFARQLNLAGYYHPDSDSNTTSQVKTQFAAGNVLMYADGMGAWLATYNANADSIPGLQVDAAIPFARDGGKAINFLDVGAFALTAIKKGDDARVQELLRILNYFAAPYGTLEFQQAIYGVEKVDFNRNAQGVPVPTDLSKSEGNTSFYYIASCAPIISSPLFPDQVKAQYAWEQKVAPLGVSDPTVGFYSETAARSGAQLTKSMQDALNGIISGRAPLSDLKSAVATWKSGGGDKIRQELQDALGASGS